VTSAYSGPAFWQSTEGRSLPTRRADTPLHSVWETPLAVYSRCTVEVGYDSLSGDPLGCAEEGFLADAGVTVSCLPEHTERTGTCR
jgi:hypothetical protein